MPNIEDLLLPHISRLKTYEGVSPSETLAEEAGTARLLITGDLGIAAHYCDTVAVMQAGRIVEINETDRLFDAPRHPYTRHLLDCVRV